jgi:hypothetical protein
MALSSVEVVDCTTDRTSPWHLDGCFGWYLRNPVRLAKLLPMSARVGFFHVDEDDPAIREALAAYAT